MGKNVKKKAPSDTGREPEAWTISGEGGGGVRHHGEGSQR